MHKVLVLILSSWLACACEGRRTLNTPTFKAHGSGIARTSGSRGRAKAKTGARSSWRAGADESHHQLEGSLVVARSSIARLAAVLCLAVAHDLQIEQASRQHVLSERPFGQASRFLRFLRGGASEAQATETGEPALHATNSSTLVEVEDAPLQDDASMIRSQISSLARGDTGRLSMYVAVAHSSRIAPGSDGRPTVLTSRTVLTVREAPSASNDETLAADEAIEEAVEEVVAEARLWARVQQNAQKAMRFFTSLMSPNTDYAAGKEEDMMDERGKDCGYAPDDESWRTQRKNLNEIELSPAAQKRVMRDLRRFMKGPSPGLELEDTSCLTDWVVKFVGMKGTIFEDEIYRMRIRFHADYPMRPPTVTFMRPAPMYEHVYTNGMICLDLLANAWDPSLDALGICLSIQSMMASATKKTRPPDNEMTSRLSMTKNARDMAWHPHDDNC